MRRILGFLAGVLVGQWLVFGGALSPADLHIRASAAWETRDYPEALRLWSQAVSLQPGNAELHYLRGRALAALGLRASAADAFQVSLLLEPQSTIAREAIDGLAGLQPTAAGAIMSPPRLKPRRYAASIGIRSIQDRGNRSLSFACQAIRHWRRLDSRCGSSKRRCSRPHSSDISTMKGTGGSKLR